MTRLPNVNLRLVAAHLCGVVASGCAGEPPAIATESDSAGVRILMSAQPQAEWQLSEEPFLDLGSSNEAGPTQFFQIEGALFLAEDRFVVANRGTEQLRFFMNDGSFLGAAGGDGRGPEEFRGLSWIATIGDSLLAHDWGNDRISVRDQSGVYGRSFRLEWTSGLLAPLILMNDGTLLALSVRSMTELHQAGTQVELGLVSQHRPTGARIDSVGRYPVSHRVVHRDGDLQTTVGLPLSSDAAFAPSDSGFCYVFGPAAQVSCYDPEGHLTLIARVDSAAKPVSPDVVDRAFEHELERARQARNEPRERALLRARSSMSFPDYLPAFTDLLADDQGRLWARRHALPGQAQTEWWVFEEGRWLARLPVDAALEVMDVRGNRILGLWRDYLGVERIRLYRFEAG